MTDSEVSSVIAPTVPKKSSGKKIYNGRILSHINLNDRGSNKETYHIEVEAEDVVYLPGDSIGIIPENKRATVMKLFQSPKLMKLQTLTTKVNSFSL